MQSAVQSGSISVDTCQATKNSAGLVLLNRSSMSSMSDQEDNTQLGTQSEPSEDTQDLGEGACGGAGLRPSTPNSEGDNLSMEVQFGEGSSRHASDISSISYQNLLDDDITGPALSRRDSEDSVDSFLPEYTEDIVRDDNDDDINTPTQTGQSYSDKISDRISIQMTDDHIHISTEDYGLDGLGKIGKSASRSVNSDPGPMEQDGRLANRQGSSALGAGRSNNITLSVQESFRKHELVVSQKEISPQRSRSLPPGDDVKAENAKKRNSLEIRNNIPVYGEVKNYERDIERLAYSNQGAKPKIKKQSPGLACRVEDNTNVVSPSISDPVRETNMDSATKIINDLIQVSKANSLALNAQSKRISHPEVPQDSHIINGDIKHNGDTSDVLVPQPSTNIENEYEYVKYARIQEGNSYVGMRLAYSSSEADQDKTEGNTLNVNGLDSNIVDSSQEGTPERFSHHRVIDSNSVRGNLNEDMLTEIPLNGPDNCTVIDGENNKLFTLSPENTECDSVEIESVTSEGTRSPVGMPNVEDGLSSSQASDLEDNVNPTDHDTPTRRLQRKQQQELEQKLQKLENISKPREMDAQAIMDDLKLKREALDMAIADIKTAIQKSKGVALEAPYKDDDDGGGPVWVKRDEDNTAPGGGTTREVIQDQDRLAQTREHEMACREHERVYSMENEKDRLLQNQYTRNDGKVYQTPKGYDSDDEYEDADEIKYTTRRNKGKKYTQLPKDETHDHSDPNRMLDTEIQTSSLRISDSVSMYGDSNSYAYTQDSRHNSESQCSSEDFGSDPEVPSKNTYIHQKGREGEFDTDEETDQLLEKQYQGNQYVDIPELSHPPINRSAQAEKRRSRAKEVSINDPENPSVLIEGVLFRAKYLGSTQLISEGQPSKTMRMMQAQEAVGRIKAPEGENQPSTEVDVFVSTEKIMVLNTDLQEIMMDHSLRTISYIADIGDILVIMARRRLIGSPGDTDSMRKRKQAKILCHVFETEEAQLIAQSIGQAFQVAYMEFLKANGIEDPGLMKEIDYQDVLNQQEIYGEELNLFANKEMHKEVVVPKLKGELLGVVIVESGWGSMVPTVVLANMSPTGPSARCGQLNIGDQIISVNGISLVGLPLSACQTYIKSAKNQTVVKLTVVPCPPVVEVCIKRPDVKYQLGFSVQNGVICSLLRGGIAERGGVRVGHRIIEINSQSVVAVPHEKIVSLLANSVGEIHMKTMPTSIFRLLTGQEIPHYL